jgi:hypothetical protein
MLLVISIVVYGIILSLGNTSFGNKSKVYLLGRDWLLADFASQERQQHTASICTYARGEEAYIDEWTDYHLAIGYAKIFVYDNNKDNELKFWRNDRRLGDSRIAIVHWPKNVDNLRAHVDCAERAIAKNHTGAAFFDIDEFLVLRQHKDVASLLYDNCQAGELSINWYLFGSGGHLTFNPTPVTKRFTMRRPTVNPHVKSILRLRDITRRGWSLKNEFHGIPCMSLK